MNDNLLNAAINYAKSDPSDPFALARAKAHIRSGVASYSDKNGQSAFYSAEGYTEARRIELPNGRVLEGQVTIYRNVIRP